MLLCSRYASPEPIERSRIRNCITKCRSTTTFAFLPNRSSIVQCYPNVLYAFIHMYYSPCIYKYTCEFYSSHEFGQCSPRITMSTSTFCIVVSVIVGFDKRFILKES
ncbi:hypothetical protein RB195_020490 [Necator americanus]|uniref:Uncharacterized protein n=1 Tax=Necator americanus TaxID=51031 RepID=A0ABR1CJ37_NECAM